MKELTNCLKYAPSPKNLWSLYEELETICDERLSPAKIVKVARLSDKKVFIFKILDKSKLFGEF